MDFDDIVVQMQAGTVTAFAAFADALIKSGAMDPKALIASLLDGLDPRACARASWTLTWVGRSTAVVDKLTTGAVAPQQRAYGLQMSWDRLTIRHDSYNARISEEPRLCKGHRCALGHHTASVECSST